MREKFTQEILHSSNSVFVKNVDVTLLHLCKRRMCGLQHLKNKIFINIKVAELPLRKNNFDFLQKAFYSDFYCPQVSINTGLYKFYRLDILVSIKVFIKDLQ